MISLVNDKYFERAWCAAEVLLMQTLREYGHHKHLEHNVQTAGDTVGHLASSVDRLHQLKDIGSDMEKFKLSQDEDLPTINFLVRQAKLLEKPKR